MTRFLTTYARDYVPYESCKVRESFRRKRDTWKPIERAYETHLANTSTDKPTTAWEPKENASDYLKNTFAKENVKAAKVQFDTPLSCTNVSDYIKEHQRQSVYKTDYTKYREFTPKVKPQLKCVKVHDFFADPLSTNHIEFSNPYNHHDYMDKQDSVVGSKPVGFYQNDRNIRQQFNTVKRESEYQHKFNVLGDSIIKHEMLGKIKRI